MRILLDAKDLINLVERGRPLGPSDFRGYLEEREGQLVLTFTNVVEFAAPLGEGADQLEVRAKLQTLEALPVCYLSSSIVADELCGAVEAFDSESALHPINPYVSRWDKGMVLAGPSVAEMFVNYRLDEVVFDVWRGNPRIFGRFRTHLDLWRGLIAQSRELLPAGWIDENTYWVLIQRHLVSNSLPGPDRGLEEFGRWLYEDPRRCPAVRLLSEVIQEVRRNVGDEPKESDLADLAYVPAIPYVDAATLDRRMLHYCKTAARRLKQQKVTVDYDERLYRNLQDLVDAEKGMKKTARRGGSIQAN